MKQMMDAIVKPTAGPGLELRQVPVPVPGPGEVLIKIHKTAICGSDVHIYKWNQWAQQHVKPPQVIGHEYVGEVAELGAGVTGFTVGQRVSGEGHITCGHCRNCHTGNIQWCKHHVGVGVDRDGAFAEYVCIPSRNVIAIDESLPEDVVSFFDAFGNATHTALMFPLIGEDVLITGAGPIGIYQENILMTGLFIQLPLPDNRSLLQVRLLLHLLPAFQLSFPLPVTQGSHPAHRLPSHA